MKRNVEKYDYNELNDAASILTAIGMPKELCNPRCVMTLAAIAEVASGKWNKLSETYKDTHYIKEYINLQGKN